LSSRECERIFNSSRGAYLIDQVLISLEDGEWHDLDELSNEVQLPAYKVKKILLFLSEFMFIEFDAEGQRARIAPTTKRWLQRLRQVEK